MPTIGSFHGKFWKARNNVVAPPGETSTWMYPKTQGVVTMGMHAIAFGLPVSALAPLLRQLRFLWSIVRSLWWTRDTIDQLEIADAIARVQRGESLLVKEIVREVVREVVEVPAAIPIVKPAAAITPSKVRAWWTWGQRVLRLDPDQRAALERAITVMESPAWHDAKAAVATVATSPKFHHQDQWVEYSRAMRANIGQAQNVFRHVKAVAQLRGLQDGEAVISNPDAHLLVELAYQGAAATKKPAQRIDHPARVIDHPVLHRKDA